MSYFSSIGKHSVSDDPTYSNYYAIQNDKRYQFLGDIGADVALRNLEDFLSSLPKSKRVVLILDIPTEKQLSPESLFAGSRLTGARVLEGANKLNISIQKNQAKVSLKLSQLAKRSGIEYIDPTDIFCKEGLCKVLKDGEPIYKDNNHFSSRFVRKYALFIDSLVLRNP
jgi:hypothetical protein